MVWHPLDRRVGEDHVQPRARELRDVAALKPDSAAGVLRRLLKHRVGAIQPNRLRRLRPFVQHPSQLARAAAEVNDAALWNGLNQVQQVVERLLPLRLEAGVLVGLPFVASRSGHEREPTNSPVLA